MKRKAWKGVIQKLYPNVPQADKADKLAEVRYVPFFDLRKDTAEADAWLWYLEPWRPQSQRYAG